MMNFKLINKQTSEEYICTKMAIAGVDYYVSNEIPNHKDWAIYSNPNRPEKPPKLVKVLKTDIPDKLDYENPNLVIRHIPKEWFKSVIATNTPNIGIPIADENHSCGQDDTIKIYYK